MLRQDAAIAANRFGLGARPGDAAAIGSDPQGWLAAQLESIPPAPGTGQPESARVLAEVRELRVARQAAAQIRANLRSPPEQATPPAAPGIDEQAIREFGAFIREHYVEHMQYTGKAR